MTKTNSIHRKVKVSTSKSRKGLKRPAQKLKITHFSEAVPERAQVQVKISKAPTKVQTAQPQSQQSQTQGQARQIAVQDQSNQPAKSAKSFDMRGVNAEMKRRAEQRKKEVSEQPVISARKIKEQEIAKAISSTNRSLSQDKNYKHPRKIQLGFHRVVLAVACAAVAVFAIVYAVDLNSPDVSLKVAAMQTGIEAHYPNYIPRGYSLSDVTSESGKITLNFRSNDGDAFSLIETRSDWNTNTLYNEFVRPTFGDNYTVVSAGGADVYISGSDAAWVSDGIFYRIVTKSGTLTKKQISTIASKL